MIWPAPMTERPVVVVYCQLHEAVLMCAAYAGRRDELLSNVIFAEQCQNDGGFSLRPTVEGMVNCK